MPPWTHDAALVAAHPELHHYTNRAGFQGIWSSQTLWATHFANLQDSAEIVLARSLMVDALVATCRKVILDRQKKSFAVKRRAAREGGLDNSARKLAHAVVDAHYEVSFSRIGRVPLAEPYICSFCSHSADQDYERTNGLLSQWRGYGRSGRFCLVFDTAKLDEMLATEWTSHYWTRLGICEAIYVKDESPIEARFPQLIDLCAQFLNDYFDRAEPKPEGMFVPFSSAATLIKHRGFFEEREVRIVAIPFTSEMIQSRKLQDQTRGMPPLKEIHSSSKRSYIALFDASSEPLPIKRIIVGPGMDQERDVEFARTVVGQRIPIWRSETPFTGE